MNDHRRAESHERRDPGNATPEMSRRAEFFWLAAVLAASLYVYRGAFAGFFVQDDFGWILDSRFESLSDYLKAFFRFSPALGYRPLSQETFFWAGQNLFGLQPFGFHVLSALFHFAGTACVYLVLRLFFPAIPSLPAALFYAVHNAHFRSVYWISAVAEPMALACFAAAIYFFVRFDREGQRGLYAASLLMMCLGMLCKESILSLPLVLAAYCLFLARGGMLRTVPFFALAGFYALARLTSGAVQAAPYSLTFGGEALQNLLAYLSWTAGFSETILFVILKWQPAEGYPWIGAALLILMAALILLSRNRRAALFAAAWFGLSLQPVLYFRDHAFSYYLAPSLAAFSLLLASALSGARGRWRAAHMALPLLFIAGAAYAGELSVNREGRWWNERSFAARRIVEEMPGVAAQVPAGRFAYIFGFEDYELGAMQNDAAFQVYGISPYRFIIVGLDGRTYEQIDTLEANGGIAEYYCFHYHDGGFVNTTELFRQDPGIFYLDKAGIRGSGVSLAAYPAELYAGRDTLRLEVHRLDADSLDVVYSIDGGPPQRILDWRLDGERTAAVPVDKNTKKGRYRFLAVRNAQAADSRGWILVDAEVTVR